MKGLLVSTGIFIISICANVFASPVAWKEVTIPDTKCGNGQEYKIYIKHGDPKKVAIEFMGGGMCWDKESCSTKDYGEKFTTNMPSILSRILVEKNKKSPVSKHTMIYLPYCTGDIHIGNHTASYGFHHYGFNNIVKTFTELSQRRIINFEKIKDLFVLGWSAGAIGAGTHTKTLDLFAVNAINKTLIMDSPGLHWGDNVWTKFFTPDMQKDLENSFKIVGMTFDGNDGNMAKDMDKFCQSSNTWYIGLLQSTKDAIMSERYGATTKKEHKESVIGQDGILSSFSKTNNCVAWVIDNSFHTFMLIPSTQKLSVNGVSAREFVFGVYNRTITRNISYLDEK